MLSSRDAQNCVDALDSCYQQAENEIVQRLADSRRVASGQAHQIAAAARLAQGIRLLEEAFH